MSNNTLMSVTQSKPINSVGSTFTKCVLFTKSATLILYNIVQ